MKRIGMLIGLLLCVLSVSAKDNFVIIIAEWKFEVHAGSKCSIDAKGDYKLLKEITEPVTLSLTYMSGDYLIQCHQLGINWKMKYGSYVPYEDEAPLFGIKNEYYNFSVDPDERHIVLFTEEEGTRIFYIFKSPKASIYNRSTEKFEPLSGSEWVKSLRERFPKVTK